MTISRQTAVSSAWVNRFYGALTVVSAFFLLSPLSLYAADDSRVSAVPVSSPVAVGNVLQVITVLILVIVLIIGGAWMARRFGGMGKFVHKELRVLAGMSLGAREKVVLIQAGDTQMLLGVAPGRIQTLHVFDNPVINDDSPVVNEHSFIDKLNEVIRKK